MTIAEKQARMTNFLLGLASTLLAGSLFFAFTTTGRLSSMEATMQSVLHRLDKIEAKLDK